MKLFKSSIAAATLATVLGGTAHAQTTAFTPGHLAVLRVGDPGAPFAVNDFNGGKSNPLFVDDFDPSLTNATAPVYSAALPTNGNNSVWINGGAGTEGGMTLSADRSLIALTGYHGDLGSLGNAAPSSLPYKRAIGVVDPFGASSLPLISDAWYGSAVGAKTNPRGVVSDGTNSFWGSGNNLGTLYFNPGYNDGSPAFLQNFEDTRVVKIINNTLYTSVLGKDAKLNYPAGIYNFLDFFGNPSPLPQGFAGFHLVIPVINPYTNISGFYLNSQASIAYVADIAWGVQKYIKAGGVWKFACNYNVQGYENGVITNDVKNGFGGCFDVVADFSGTNPVIYAVTEDTSSDGKNANSNRVVRIVDTNTAVTGLTYTNFTVVARTTTLDVGFRALDFAPDLRPVIIASPGDQSVVTNTPVTFSIQAGASALAGSYSTISYQWLQNGNGLAGQTNTTLSLTPDLSYNGNTYQCVVSNIFGAVTSSPPANLTVTTTPVPPHNTGALQHLTNAIGDNVNLSVSAAGTTPLSYQWFVGDPAAGGQMLSDTGEFTNTATGTLLVSGAQIGVDDTNYYCVVTNLAGASNIFAATLKLVYTPPVFSTTPGATTVFSNTPAQFNAAAFGASLFYQWYSNNVAIAGANDPSLTINPAVKNANITLVVTNFGGSVTSAVAALTVIARPPNSFVSYTNAGQIYVQNFNSLPVVTNITANTGNPVSIWQAGSTGTQVIYSIDDPFDFAYPVLPTGGLGGLGLSNTMSGWYGWGALSSKLGAHQGDQSTGGVIDYGTLATNNLNLGETNRALGLQSTSTTGNSAFGVKFMNKSTNTLTQITLSYLGEVWRNQGRSNTLVFSYYLDLTGTNAFSPTNITATFVSSLNVSFNTNAGGILAIDGSQPVNQISLAVTNLAIGNWPTNAALWLVWQQNDSIGSAQGLAIDSLSFSANNAPSVPVVTQPTISGVTYIAGGVSGGLQFSFTNSPGASSQFTVWGTTNLAPALWQNLGHPVEGSSGHYQFTDSQATNRPQQFYEVTSP